jgi:serine/threonine protein kinase
MGIVYACTQLGSGRRVAIKWLFESAANRGERRRRFLREARAASTIEHSSVVRVFDAGEHERGVFLAMELLTGESLRLHLQKNDLSVREAVDLLMPALRGIAAAHHKGVIHRDLKPENLLVCPRPNGKPEIKVLDFGLSKLIAGHSDSLHTLPGAMLGTPQYMAPEQIEGSGRVDARCDLYSMAAILYEAVAGRRPFEALTLADLLAKLARDEPPQLRQVAKALNKDVPPEFSQAVMRALNRDPAQRQDTVEDFAIALEPFGTQRFHSTAAARDEYAETLRTRRESESFVLPSRLSGKGAVIGWLALITIAVGWLAVRVLSAPSPDERALEGLPVAKPAAVSTAPAAPLVHKDLVVPVAVEPPATLAPQPQLPQQAYVEPPPAEPAAIAPRKSVRRPALRARNVQSSPSPSKPKPAKLPRRTDILDPWE